MKNNRIEKKKFSKHLVKYFLKAKTNEPKRGRPVCIAHAEHTKIACFLLEPRHTQHGLCLEHSLDGDFYE